MSIREIKKKGSVFTSGGTVYRYKEPTSDRVNVMTQFRVDYRYQKAAVPNMVGKATQGVKNGLVTVNRNGRSACLGPMFDAFNGACQSDEGKF